MRMHACLSVERMEKSGILMQSFTRIYPDPGLKRKERLKVEIQTYSKAQKP